MKRSLDLVLALILAVVSAVIAQRAYVAMIAMEGPSHVLLSSVDLGISYFHLMSGERCIGEFSTNLSEDQGWIFRAEGSIRSVYGKESSTAAIMVLASFNTLGQLTDSGSDVSGVNTRLNLRTKGINPIKLTLDARVRDRAVVQELSAPGPVVIKKIAPQKYRVQYSGLRSTHGGILQVLGDSLKGEVGAGITQVPEAQRACPPESRSAFDVASLMLKSRGLEQFVQRFVPDAIP